MSDTPESALNPYQSPAHPSGLQPGEPAEAPLASRINRLGAVIVDGLIGLLLGLPLVFLFGLHTNPEQGVTVSATLLMSLYGVVMFFVVHGYLLANHGQTVGKKLAKIQIVDDRSNRLLPLGKLIGLRYFPIWLVSMIPFGNILVLIDALFIFGKDRRCVHDYLAGTKVIDAPR